MAADSAIKILLDTGVAGVFAGASGCPPPPPPPLQISYLPQKRRQNRALKLRFSLSPPPHPRSMAADSAIKILLDTGVAGVFAGASGVLLKLSRRQIGEEVDAGQQAQLALFFFTFLLGQVMALYALLFAKGVVPAVSPGLAKKLSCIPLATFLLALAVQAWVAPARLCSSWRWSATAKSLGLGKGRPPAG